MRLLRLSLLPLLAILVASPTVAQDPSVPVELAAARPLSDALDANGRLQLDHDGSFDATGYTVALGSDGTPQFRLASQADNDWAEGFFDGPGVPFGGASAVAVDGDDVYVSGRFGTFEGIGGVPGTDQIARWNQTDQRWYALGNGLDGSVFALLVDGDDLYVGGQFRRENANPDSMLFVGRWDITDETWNALGTGVKRAQPTSPFSDGIHAMALNGNELWVGGYFVNAGRIAEADLGAVWNTETETWRSLGQLFQNPFSSSVPKVEKILHLGDGVMYLGGNLSFGDGIVQNALRVDGSWQQMDALSGTESDPNGMGVYAAHLDGDDLYLIRGDEGFVGLSGVPDGTQFVRFDGTTYHPLGGHFDDRSVPLAITVFDGEILVGVGDKNTDPRPHLVHLTENGWEPYGTELDGAPTSLVVDGNALWVAGGFADTEDGTRRLGGIVKWTGTEYETIGAVGNGFVSSFVEVEAAAVFQGSLYIGGSFEDASNDKDVDYIARWDGQRWQAVGQGLNRTVKGLLATADRLYAAGSFFDVAGQTGANRLAQFDGTAWAPLGAGFGNNSPEVLAMIGTDLYVGGAFSRAGGVRNATNIARWDGSAWHALTQTNGAANPDDDVNALAVDSDGTLIVGGEFTSVYGIPYLARWNPTTRTWSAIGNQTLNGDVNALANTDAGLYVGGRFTNLGGPAGDGIALWNGTQWTPLGSGLTGFPDFQNIVQDPNVLTLHPVGTDLFVGGVFSNAGGVDGTPGIARWDGTAWQSVSSGLADGSVHTLASTETTLWAGGSFTQTGDGAKVSLGIGSHPLPGFVAAEPAADASSSLRIWPNPSHGTARIQLDMDTRQPVELTLHDALGRRVAVLFSGEARQLVEAELPAGLAPGVYVVRAMGPSVDETVRVTVVR